MIPKKIHYAWFGPGEMPYDQKAYIEEWKVIHPKWKFKLWNEQNAPMNLDYMKTALKRDLI